MSSPCTQKDVERISALLGAEKITFEKDHYRLKITNQEEKRVLVLEMYPEVDLGKSRGALVVVYAGNTHLQLHNCTGYVVSEELGEVTFVAETAEKLSGLVVEKGASCSIYASINRELISSDFTTLGVEVMLSGVAMSLAEEILESKKGDKSGK
jgi:hypothetical protein